MTITKPLYIDYRHCECCHL